MQAPSSLPVGILGVSRGVREILNNTTLFLLHLLSNAIVVALFSPPVAQD